MKKNLLSIFVIFLILGMKCNSTENYADTQKNKVFKIGIMAPFSGKYQNIGIAVLNSAKLALKDLGTKNIILYPKDNRADINESYKIAKEFEQNGIDLVIGPIFYENTKYLEKVNNLTFLALSNKLNNNPKNIITLGVNIQSQLNAIMNFLKENNYTKTLLLIPKSEYLHDIKKFYQNSNHDFYKIVFYETDPKKITFQIETITKYKNRKNELEIRKKKLENSDLIEHKNELKKLILKDTLGDVEFDSVIVADFDERLKSVMASFDYVDVNKDKVKFFTLNQWFSDNLFDENSMQGLMFPSVDLNGYNNFRKKYFKFFDKVSSEISLSAYDAIGLAFYIYKNNNSITKPEKFNTKVGFKGLQGNFNIKNNRANHKLYIYEISKNKFINLN